MIDYIFQPFFQRAIIISLLIGLITGFISIFIVLRRMSFVGVGISHSLFGAVAIAYFLNLPVSPSILIFAVLIGLFIYEIRKKVTIDASIGIIFSFSMALGVLLLNFSKGYGVDLMGFLFGSIISITRVNLFYTIGSSLIIVIILFIFNKDFLFIAFDESLSKVYGIKTTLIDRIFFIVTAISIAIGIKVMGIILISTVLVIPGAFALLFTYNYKKAIGVAIIMNIVSIIAGVVLSTILNIPSGSTIIILQITLFFMAFLSFSIFNKKESKI